MRCGEREISVERVYQLIQEYGLQAEIDRFFAMEQIQEILQENFEETKKRCMDVAKRTSVTIWLENQEHDVRKHVEANTFSNFSSDVKMKCMCFIISSILDQVDASVSGEKIGSGIKKIKESLIIGSFLLKFYVIIESVVQDYVYDLRRWLYDNVTRMLCNSYFE